MQQLIIDEAASVNRSRKINKRQQSSMTLADLPAAVSRTRRHFIIRGRPKIITQRCSTLPRTKAGINIGHSNRRQSLKKSQMSAHGFLLRKCRTGDDLTPSASCPALSKSEASIVLEQTAPSTDEKLFNSVKGFLYVIFLFVLQYRQNLVVFLFVFL